MVPAFADKSLGPVGRAGSEAVGQAQPAAADRGLLVVPRQEQFVGGRGVDDEDRAAVRVFRAAKQYAGASQSRIAVATGLLQGRVSEIMRGARIVSTLDLFERIAGGLDMPDDARMLLGLAPQHPAGLDHLSVSGRAEVIAVYPSQSAALTEIHGLATSAHDIDVLAVRGLGILGLNDSLLRTSVQANAPAVRVLLLDPDSEAA